MSYFVLLLIMVKNLKLLNSIVYKKYCVTGDSQTNYLSLLRLQANYVKEPAGKH